MRFFGFFLFLLIIFSDRSAFAQKQGTLTQSRILILLDESSSMIQTWNSGRPKYKAADELILRLMDSIYAVNPQVEFSLRVFGHQHTVAENNCYDTKNEVAFSKDNRVQMAFRLEDIHPLGVTAIAYSLKQAAEYDLVDEQHNAYSIILITDGGESCGGDICAVMDMLRKNKVYFKPYIVSLEDYPELKNTYACMGDYLQVTKDGDIPVAVNTIVNAFRPIIKITQAEYSKMQTIVANAPSVLKVDIPTIKTEPVVDTAKKVKPRKDTIVTPVAPETPAPAPRPKAEKISKLSASGPKALRIPTPVTTNPKTVAVTGTLPPIAAPVPTPPPVVKEAPEKITRLKLKATKNFTIYSQYDGPPVMKTVATGKMPALVIAIDTPKPVVVAIKLPSPEKIAKLTPTRTVPVKIQQPAAFTVSTVTPRKLPTLVIDTPKPVVVAIKLPSPEKIAKLTPTRTVKVNVPQAPAFTVNTVTPRKLPALVIDTPKPVVVAIKLPTPEKIAKLTPTRGKPITIQPAAALKLKTAKAPPLPAIVFEVPAPVVPERTKPAAEKIARLKPAPPRSINWTWIMDERNIAQRKTPPMPAIKIDIPVVPASKAPVADKTPGGKKLDYEIKIEDAKVTSLEIYIVNSRGQLVSTTPQVALLDPATKAEIKKFYRTVDAAGNPDPQENIPVGSYTLTFPAKKDLTIPNVKLEKNKRNKITIKVPDVSLVFKYFGAPDRVVKEFGARVIERNQVKGRVQDQPCSVKLKYEPGNYHIRISTFPEDVRNVDLDLEGETIITILQPGFAKFTCDTKQSVTLWKEDGNKFAQFHQLDLNDPRSQHLQIQPGKYQVHYRKGPGGPSVSTKVKQFIVTSNTETEVLLD